jgi:S-adenosylmethionine decarboxylase proenzyme
VVKSLGRHLLIELYDCDAKAISEVAYVQEVMVRAAKAAKATIVDVMFHTFNPHGVSGVVVIAESHLAIHTWPEHGHASIDVYTCGSTINPWRAYSTLRRGLKAKRITAVEMKRGLLAA